MSKLAKIILRQLGAPYLNGFHWLFYHAKISALEFVLLWINHCVAVPVDNYSHAMGDDVGHIDIQSDALEGCECGTLPKEKRPRAMCGVAVYGIKYNSDWESNFPFISRGKCDKIYSFYCKVCHKDVSCRHQGISETREE